MKVTYLLVLANIIVFALGMGWPLQSDWSLIGYGFTHGNAVHLGINMLGLLIFGVTVENQLGWWRLVLFYLVCIVAGGILQLHMSGIPAVGASAGVFGLVTAFCVMFPQRRVWFFFIPMRASVLLPLSIAIELAMMFFDLTPNVAHWAHLGGVLGAVIQLSIRKW